LSAWSQLSPQVDGVLDARLTNAAGFGRADSYYAGVTATWRLDLDAAAAARRFDQQAAIAKLRESQAERSGEQQLKDAVADAEASLQTFVAARSNAAYQQSLLALVRQQQQAGVTTATDVTLAEQQAFAAEVLLIEANANIKLARVLVRLAAGLAP
jgi:outer membrane protein TolC